MLTSPIARECPAHDGFFHSRITLPSPLPGLDPTKPEKSRGGKGGCKRRRFSRTS